MKTIALFGGSFNPPGAHHRVMAEELTKHVDEVIVIPCGPRPDKQTTTDAGTVHRAAMADIAFRGIPRVRVDLFDLEREEFTRTVELDEQYREKEGEIWHVVGSDLVRGGRDGNSPIQREWAMGPDIWRRLNFLVLQRPGQEADAADLPPRSKFITGVSDPFGSASSAGIGGGASTLIRNEIFNHRPFEHLVVPDVADYIRRWGLYRGIEPVRSARWTPQDVRALVVADDDREEAKRMASVLRPLVDEENPTMIIAVGGDGTMLKAIRKHWRRRIPFFGVHTGHRGFLLNDLGGASVVQALRQTIVLRHLPLLFVETESTNGERGETVAFNDAWVERDTGQTAWIRVSVDGEERIGKLVADGVLVATAQGSTAYARSMGAPSLPVGTSALVLAGSHVASPEEWRPAVLPLSSRVAFEALDPEKRPLRGFVDGTDRGEVRHMHVRMSAIASVELAFLAPHDIEEKLTAVQFPHDG